MGITAKVEVASVGVEVAKADAATTTSCGLMINRTAADVNSIAVIIIAILRLRCIERI